MKKISKYNHYNGGNIVQYIVLHDVGALGQVRSNLNYFASGNRGASAHLFVDDTEIGQSVEFFNPAWHVGDDKPNDQYDVGDLIHNRNSIGVEMCLGKDWKVTEQTKKNTIELVQYLMKLYPNAKIVRHYDASGKICPRSMSGNNWQEWNEFKARIKGAPAISNKPHTNTPNAIKIKSGDTLWGIAKQYNTDVQTIKSLNGLRSDVIQIGQVLKIAGTVGKPTAKPKPQPKPSKQPDPIIKGIQANVGEKQDGWDGTNTRKGTRKLFQRAVGTNDDGIIGKNTLNKAPVIRLGSRGWHVYALQAMLYLKGYKSVGTPDKVAGTKTIEALAQYQRDNGLTVDREAWKAVYGRIF